MHDVSRPVPFSATDVSIYFDFNRRKNVSRDRDSHPLKGGDELMYPTKSICDDTVHTLDSCLASSVSVAIALQGLAIFIYLQRVWRSAG